ncbi:hypothetical protein [Rhizobium mongolense]|uniref:Uncharacterized protein n=1 Tax=Rhizobium mongolense TaxID=57676 RepID=A0A7W6RHY3_9HYPH|nr:hypothetical protein [Rhizobium mongolense]MBB4272785.1 hypothetical protein [Rhizobium mongolense]
MDLTISASAVIAGSGVPTERGIAGATIAAGDVVYLDSTTTGKWQLADSDAATSAARGLGKTGIALNSASLNQPLIVQTSGAITLGAVLTAGTAYYLSDTPGKICPVADITGGDYFTLLGLASSTSVLNLDIQYSDVASS